MITVAQLIGHLQKYPGGLRVVLNAYEMGLDNAVEPCEIRIDLDVRDPSAGPDIFLEGESGSPAVFIGTVQRPEPIFG